MSVRINRRGRKFITVVIVLAVIAIAAVVFLHDQNNRLVVDELDVPVAKLPAGFEGFRIAQVSDLHGKEFGKDNKKLVEKIKEAEPDLIAVTGDLIDDENQLPVAEVFISALSEIAPVYYVSGNHEWSAGVVGELEEMLSQNGGRFFDERYEEIQWGGSRMIIAGVDDPKSSGGGKTLREMMKEMRVKYPDDFVMLLSHRNESIGEYSRNGINLALAGRAHGGIIRLPYIEGVFDTEGNIFPAYTSGRYTLDDTVMVVSRGLGNGKDAPFMRMFNHPQLLILTLERERADEG